MQLFNRILRGLAVAGLAAATAATGAQPADWLAKPARIIVPAPAGGPFDRTIRPIALKLALAHPRRLSALAVCDSSLALDHPVLLDAIEKRRITHKAATMEERSLGRWFLDNHPDKAVLYAQINHFNPSAHAIADADWGTALSRLMAPGRRIPMAALREVACPTLLLMGCEDPIVPVAVMREVSQLIPASEVVVVPDAGHSAYFEKPDTFNTQVLDFLARRAPPRHLG